MLTMHPRPSSDDAVIIAVTWTCRQYEFSAGTRGPGATSKNDTAIAIVRTANIRTNPPSVRIFDTPSTSTR